MNSITPSDIDLLRADVESLVECVIEDRAMSDVEAAETREALDLLEALIADREALRNGIEALKTIPGNIEGGAQFIESQATWYECQEGDERMARTLADYAEMLRRDAQTMRAAFDVLATDSPKDWTERAEAVE